MRLSRRGLVMAVVAAAALALSACSTGATGSGAATGSADAAGSAPSGSADAFPVTVKHAFGETTIAKQPQRVATVSWVNADVALALGVVPVGMAKDEWGANENGSTPWKDAALAQLGASIGSAKAPQQYSEADGINFTGVAQAAPDVILAAYSGLTKADYDKLSKIAPVVAYPEVAWGTPWQESTELIGQALGRSQQAAQLVAQTEQTIKDKAAKFPSIAGKTFIYGNLEPDSGAGINVYTPQDNRPRFLTQIGMKLAPVIDEKTKDEKAFFIEWSPEKAKELQSDVFVTWVPDDKTKDAIGEDPLLGQIPAVKGGALVADSDNTLTLAISASSPLSLPWALDAFLPQLGAAADAAG